MFVKIFLSRLSGCELGLQRALPSTSARDPSWGPQYAYCSIVKAHMRSIVRFPKLVVQSCSYVTYTCTYMRMYMYGMVIVWYA